MDGHKRFNNCERVVLSIGIGLMSADGIASLDRWHFSRVALRRFDDVSRASQEKSSPARPDLSHVEEADFRGWTAARVKAYGESRQSRVALAVLRIESLNIRVPVFEGTDAVILNRGAGWIRGTARPGESGNVGIAAHRDSFFRDLKGISRGDTIEFSTPDRVQFFEVDQIEIVNPDNVGVLRPRTVSSVTLVTCYPFNFIGSAPQRFVVHAALRERGPAARLKGIRIGQSDDSKERMDRK